METSGRNGVRNHRRPAAHLGRAVAVETSDGNGVRDRRPAHRVLDGFRTNLCALAISLRRPASPSRRKACVAFRDAPAHRIHVAFWDIARAKKAKRPTLNTVITGAAIASCNCGPIWGRPFQ